MWLVVLISVLGVVPWLRSGVPKFIIIASPALVFCFVEGFNCVLGINSTRGVLAWPALLLIFLEV